MNLNLIVACDEDYGIGNRGGLLYHFKEDLQHFRRLTTGKTIVMGRRTWESLPHKLPHRQHVVVSSNPVAGADLTVSDIKPVLTLAQNQEVWVIGGSQIYEMFAEYVNRIFLTRIHASRPADTRVCFLAQHLDRLRVSEQQSLRALDALSGQEYDLTFFSYETV